MPAGSLPVTFHVPPAGTRPDCRIGAKITGPLGTAITFQPMIGESSAATTLSWIAKPSSKSAGTSAAPSVDAGALTSRSYEALGYGGQAIRGHVRCTPAIEARRSGHA